MYNYQSWILLTTIFSAALLSGFLTIDTGGQHTLKPEEMAFLTVDRVSVGMNALEVTQSLGNLNTVKVKDDYEIWLYPSSSVLMRSGKVFTVAGESLFLNQNLVLQRGSSSRLSEVALSQLGLDPSDSRTVPSSGAIFFSGKSALTLTRWMNREHGLLPSAINVELTGSVVSRIQLGNNDGFLVKDGWSVDDSLFHWDSVQNWVATKGVSH